VNGLKFGIVAIGRNEGERLKACLLSAPHGVRFVYVDSGSTDGSIMSARAAGAEIVNLNLKVPFTAARARNAGFEKLLELEPLIEFVQFVDGDCELNQSWPPRAISFLEEHPRVAAVAGRRRERFPKESVFNWLCDREWSGPAGETKAFGGDVLIRAAAFRSVGGYRDTMIAGEEPELCVRLRAIQWRIWRLDAEMTLHDAGMTKFSQWWRRNLRAGYSYALGASLHGARPVFHKVKEARRAWIWGIWLPIAIVTFCAFFSFWGLLILGLYAVQVLRLILKSKGSFRDRATIAFFNTLSKFPEGLGQVMFVRDRIFLRNRRLIEYK
jgi:glycosyltransferase involved in cell wall biosynthesis